MHHRLKHTVMSYNATGHLRTVSYARAVPEPLRRLSRYQKLRGCLGQGNLLARFDHHSTKK
jgi:hypothetical protein